MTQRQANGSFIAENAAVMVFLFLGLLFPLINLGTASYRYNMVCGAAKIAAHVGSSVPSITDPQNGAVAVIPAAVNKYLANAAGIKNVATKFRINSADLKTQAVTNNPWGQKLTTAADPDDFIYSMEVVVDADVSPLVPMPANGFVPQVPGLTAATHQSVSAQEVVETFQALDQ